jgi:hypothetical protein
MACLSRLSPGKPKTHLSTQKELLKKAIKQQF